MSLKELSFPSESGEAAPIRPLPCDRWIARSCLQKAIRRGDKILAARALANLFLHDPKAVWRHLIIIAIEDVGMANLVMFLIGMVAGVSPQDWEFWYAIPVSIIAVGLLLGKRALVPSRRGSRVRAALLGSLAVLLVLLGSWVAWEIYAATPCRLRSDCHV